ncbi:MAG: hypothetical protein ACFNYI_05795 [Eubacterium sp.]
MSCIAASNLEIDDRILERFFRPGADTESIRKTAGYAANGNGFGAAYLSPFLSSDSGCANDLPKFATP